MNFNNKPKYSYILYIVIIIIAFVIYGNSIKNDYALDDAIVITENQFTKNGIDGISDILTNDSFTGFFGKQKKLVSGGRYRPLSLVTFAIEYEFFGANPHISHFLNIILYALIGILIFILTKKIFSSNSKIDNVFLFAFLTSILFITHPIHTEVVANIKGRDEILALLFSLASLLFAIKYSDNLKFQNGVIVSILFFVALLSKENSVSFIILIPLAIYFYQKKTDWKRVLKIEVFLIIPLVIFLIIRTEILGGFNIEQPTELMNNPFLYASLSEKYATIIYTLGLYIKLIVFPHPLTFDYYPFHISYVNWNNIWVILSLIVYVVITTWSVLKLKSKNIIAFAIIIFLIPLFIVSNIIFPVGTFMNERFLFFSSLGFVIILSYVFTIYFQKVKKSYIIIISLFALIVLYSFKTIDRNKAWKNDLVLFTTDVMTSENSAKSNTSAGGKLLEEAINESNKNKKEKLFIKSIKYLRKAVSIYPKYNDALLLLGNAHYEYNRNLDSTFYYYKRILVKSSNFDKVYKNTNSIFADNKDVDYQISVYKDYMKINPNRFDVNYALGKLLGQYKGEFDKSIYYLERACNIRKNNIPALKDLSVAYGLNKNYEKSIQIINYALKLKPNDYQLYINLGISYKQIGNEDMAKKCFIKSESIKQEKK